MKLSGGEYEAFDSPWPLGRDPKLAGWHHRLGTLSSSEVSIRDAQAVGQDGRRLWDLQLECSPITVRSVRDNVLMIAERRVLLAEIDEVHVGFCVSFSGPKGSDPLFIQLVGVAPAAQRRGVGLALLTAVAERAPRQVTALATRDENVAARALNERFADSIGASIRRVRLGTYRDHDLGITRGLGYRAWEIHRPGTGPS
jgi:ribosomal protein S18 acetylase RimI-like enzyme